MFLAYGYGTTIWYTFQGQIGGQQALWNVWQPQMLAEVEIQWPEVHPSNNFLNVGKGSGETMKRICLLSTYIRYTLTLLAWLCYTWVEGHSWCHLINFRTRPEHSWIGQKEVTRECCSWIRHSHHRRRGLSRFSSCPTPHLPLCLEVRPIF